MFIPAVCSATRPVVSSSGGIVGAKHVLSDLPIFDLTAWALDFHMSNLCESVSLCDLPGSLCCRRAVTLVRFCCSNEGRALSALKRRSAFGASPGWSFPL